MIDAVRVVVLIVPAEGRKSAGREGWRVRCLERRLRALTDIQVADIDPRYGASRNLRLNVAQEGIGEDREIVEVPLVNCVRIKGMRLDRWRRTAVDRTCTEEGDRREGR